MAEEPNNRDVNIRISRFSRLGTFFSSVPFVELFELPPAMTQSQLQEIPKVTITQELAGSAIKCAVCLDEFRLNENEVCKLPCNHMYHDTCVFPWLQTNPSCPVCRASLVDGNDNTDHISVLIQQHIDRLTADFFRHIAERQGHPHWRITSGGSLLGERRSTEGESSSARTRRRIPQRAAALRANRAIQRIYRQRTRNDYSLH